MIVGMSTAMAGAGYDVMSSSLKPHTNAQTVRGRPTSNGDDERAFRKGSLCELLSQYFKCNLVLTSSK